MTALPAGMAPLPVPVNRPPHVDETARRILSQRQFQPPPRSLVQRLMGWVFEQIAKLIGQLSGGGRGSFVAWAVIILGSGVLVWTMVRLVRNRGAGRRRAGSLGPLDDQIGRASEDWAADAAGHELAGRWREALRCRYRALIADLAQRGLLDEVPGRTTGEYRSELAINLPASAVPFRALTELFERAWYGHVPVRSDDVAALRRWAGQILVAA